MDARWIRLSLVAALCAVSAGIVDASPWPTAKPATVAKAKAKVTPRVNAAAATPDTQARTKTLARDLKALTALVARQSAAIDALARRLEAAERTMTTTPLTASVTRNDESLTGSLAVSGP